jgi:hypothetical protein
MFRRLGKKNAIRRYIDLVNDCVKNAKLDFFFGSNVATHTG